MQACVSKLTTVLVISVTLLVITRRSYTPTPIPKLYTKLDSPHAPLIKAYVIGDKRELSDKIKTIHKQLNIYHLFTPSGIHFSAILLLLGLFGRFASKLHLAAISFPFFLPGLFSIKRIALIRGLSILQKRWQLSIHPFYLFLTVFILDFIFGNFKNSPHSFIYSFLFLGIIFCTFQKAKIKMIFYILVGQIIVTAFQGESFNLAASFLGILITSGFILIFPIFLLYFSIPLLPSLPLNLITNHYLNILEFAYTKTLNFPKIDLSSVIIIAMIVTTLKINPYAKGVAIGVLLLFSPTVIR